MGNVKKNSAWNIQFQFEYLQEIRRNRNGGEDKLFQNILNENNPRFERGKSWENREIFKERKCQEINLK